MAKSNPTLNLDGVKRFRNQWRDFILRKMRGRFVEPVRMLNHGYLHTFNASFDGLFLREQGSDSLLVANHPMNFGTIQSCIRTEDKLSAKTSLLHLALFEISGLSVLDFSRATAEQMAEQTVKEFLIFWTDYLNFAKADLRIYFFGGGTFAEATGGRVRSGQYVAPDTFSAQIWQRHGLSSQQLIPEYSNETFLLHIGNPLREHHSGYRNDIFMERDGLHFEIGTLNFVSHQSLLRGTEIIGIKPLPFRLREIAIGQERVLAAAAGISNLYQLPYIKPLVDAALARIGDERSALTYVDALRVLHYFFSDGWTYENLRGRIYREHRHELNKFVEILFDLGHGLSRQRTIEMMELNSELQPWHPELRQGIQNTLEQLDVYKSRRDADS